MTLARDHDKRVAQQHERVETRRQGAQMRDRDIDRAAVELFGGIAAVQRGQPQPRARRLRRERAGQPVDQRDLGIFRHPGGEDRAA